MHVSIYIIEYTQFRFLEEGKKCPIIKKYHRAANDVVPESDYCYLVTETSHKFEEVNDFCDSLGGELATIKNQDYQSLLGQFVRDEAHGSTEIWIGLKSKQCKILFPS